MEAAADQEVDRFLARVWVPPVQFGDARSLMSLDGQIYFVCRGCGQEVRMSPIHSHGRETSGLACAACGQSRDRHVVHAAVCQCTCEDCHTVQSIATIATQALECAECGSRRVAVQSARVEPPFPSSFTQGWGWEEATAAPEIFEDVLRRTRHVWGRDATADFETLHHELLRVDRHREDFADYLGWAARYVRRLRLFGEHSSTTALIGYEASMLKERCKRVGDLWSGLASIDDSLELMDSAGDDLFVLAVQSMGFADSSYSVMVAFGEAVLMEYFDEPLRDQAVAAAEWALDYFLHADDDKSTPDLVAHAQWSLGDLLSFPSELPMLAAIIEARSEGGMQGVLDAGLWPRTLDEDTRDGRLRRAVGLLSQALDSGHLTESWARAVRNSRTSAILQLDDADEDMKRTAIEDLELLVSDLSDLDEPGAVTLVQNLATIKEEIGEDEAALELRERVANHALLEAHRAVDEDDVHRQSEEYVHNFDELARAYAGQGRAMLSLCAVELGRSAATRYYTRSDDEKATAATRADDRRARDAVGWLLRTMGEPTTPLSYRPFSEQLGEVERALRNAAFVRAGTSGVGYLSYSVWLDFVLALIAVPDAEGVRHVDALSWPANVEDLLFALDAEEVWQPSQWREERLHDVCSLARDCLWRPIEDRAARLDLSSLVISAPGGLGSVPFEALATMNVNEPRVAAVSYVPSLRVLDDLRSRSAGFVSSSPARVLGIMYRGDDLPGVAAEMGMLTRVLGDRLTIIDSDAVARKELLAQLVEGDWDIIHFACHGSFDADDPWNSSLHLVRDPQRDRERLSARDLVGLRFKRSPVVVLSACSSALTSGSRSVDSAGLTGGFLRAGARGIVAARWPVYDDLAVEFMEDLYPLLANGDPPDRAVAAVQLALRPDRGIEDWAAFAYVGTTE